RVMLFLSFRFSAGQYELTGYRALDCRTWEYLAIQVMITQYARNRHIVEYGMDKAQMFFGLPLGLFLGQHFLQRSTAKSDALMRSISVLQHQVSYGVFSDGICMQGIVVIGLQITVPCHLPAWRVNFPLLVDMP